MLISRDEIEWDEEQWKESCRTVEEQGWNTRYGWEITQNVQGRFVCMRDPAKLCTICCTPCQYQTPQWRLKVMAVYDLLKIRVEICYRPFIACRFIDGFCRAPYHVQVIECVLCYYQSAIEHACEDDIELSYHTDFAQQCMAILNSASRYDKYLHHLKSIMEGTAEYHMVTPPDGFTKFDDCTLPF